MSPQLLKERTVGRRVVHPIKAAQYPNKVSLQAGILRNTIVLFLMTLLTSGRYLEMWQTYVVPYLEASFTDINQTCQIDSRICFYKEFSQ